MQPVIVTQPFLIFETVMNEFEKTISILKNNFYKEEYLK